MLYSCRSAETVAAGGPHRPGAGSKRFSVDLHCHVHTPDAEALVAESAEARPGDLFAYVNDATREVNRRMMAAIADKLVDVDVRLADMDAMGIDIQAISPAPPQFYYDTAPEVGRAAAQLVNNRIADIVGRHPDRFVGLGTVPLQAPDLAVAELERTVGDLGFRGVEIGTNVAGQELSDARFRPFFARAEALDILVFMHPHGFSDGRRLTDHYFINIIGNPLDSTIAVSHLIFSGVLDGYPKLKICIAHGGGFLPAYAGRMDHAHRAREDCRRCIQQPPTTYLKRLYFDSVVFTHDQLEYLVQQYGSDHLVLGTDYPYDMGMSDPIGFIENAAGLSAADKNAIAGLTAASLLKLPVLNGIR